MTRRLEQQSVAQGSARGTIGYTCAETLHGHA